MTVHMDDSSTDPEGAWVRGVRSGEVSAFEAMFRAYVGPLCTFAHRYVRSRARAAEIVQDVFFRVWQNRATWEPRVSLKAYLFGATRNRALDDLKHEAIVRRFEAGAMEESAPAGVARSAPRPDEEAQAADLEAALSRAVAELPERQRAVFVLRYRDGMSYAEIAEALDVVVKTVENQMTRALRTLSERLSAHLS
ncbi:MAG: RNA polymerase sigma-70 factor [Gemmatimonadaceae bacterium]